MRRISKFSIPKINNFYKNNRLSHLVTEALSHQLTWLSAQAGSGKTVLVAQTLSAMNVPTLWYHVDESDNDPATFFYYLGRAAGEIINDPGDMPFPLFTPEYTFGLNTFCIRFFEKLALTLPKNTVIVFDDFQLIDYDNPLHTALAEALSFVGSGITIAIISRSQPPQSYAKQQLSGQISIISYEALALNSEEIRELANLRGFKLSKQTCNTIYAQTQGWFIGVIFYLNQVNNNDNNVMSSKTVLDDYFSLLINFHDCNDNVLFACSVAYLPRFTTNMAKKASNQDCAQNHIEFYLNNNLFLAQYSSENTYYQFHPLFRDYLRHRAAEVFSSEQLQSIIITSADLLSSDDQISSAAELYIEASYWDSLTGLILSNAPLLLSQGRSSLLKQWISAIPSEIVSRQPWLLYWHGLSHFPFDMITCRQHLVSALHLFEQQHIKDGAYLSWSKIVDSYVNGLSGFGDLNAWLDYFHSDLKNIGPYEDEPWAGYVANSMFTALNLNHLDDTTLPYWQSISQQLCSSSSDINLLIQNLFQQCIYATFNGSTHKLDGLLFRVNLLLKDSTITPFNTLQLYLSKSILSLFALNHDEVLSTYRRSISLAYKHSLHHFNSSIIVATTASALMSNDINAAKQLQNENQPISPYMFPVDQEISAHISARILLADNNPEAALEYSKRDVQLTHSIGYKPPMVFSLLVTSQILLSLGRDEEARDHVNRALSISENINSMFYLYISLYQLAYLELTYGNFQKGIDHLKKSLNIAKTHHFMNVYTWHKPTDILLYTIALKYSIENEFVIDAISKLNLTSDSIPYHLESWPWQVKIYILRNSSIFKAGKNIEISSASNSRPLELLRAIIALGGNSLSESSLYDLLWPHSEADAAARSLTTTLHRLRKLLGKDIVTVLNHRVSLNRTVCWVDSDALLEVLNKTIDGINKHTISTSEVIFSSRTVFDLYPESRISMDDYPGWFISYHELLRSRLFTYINTVTSFLKDHHDDDNIVIRLYNFALAIDPLIERYYQGAMETLINHSRYSEAIHYYYQCSAVLNQELRMSPSPKTTQLFTTARAMANKPAIGEH